VADIFISYTSQDRAWADWIGRELEALGHVPHVHDWEISAGGNIMEWMEKRHQDANHVLCIVSATYLTKPYSSLERQAGQWAAVIARPNFVLPVFIEPCEAPTLLAPLKRCDLNDLGEADARARLKNYLAPAAKPSHASFPGPVKASSSVAFPGLSTEAPKFELPKLPHLDKEDVKAVRRFLPGRLLSRTAALLSLVSLVVGFAIVFKIGFHRLLGFDPSLPVIGLLIGVLVLAVVAQVFMEWRAERNRAALLALAIKVGVQQAGYFRIGPYQDKDQDRAKFGRPDGAEEKVLDWVRKSTIVPLYLTGDSGSGKSSLLNAFVLPKLRESDWTVLEVRAWQDPEGALREAMARFTIARRQKRDEGRTLREIVEDVTKRTSKRLLVVIDQFEEFLILASSARHQEFAAFISDIRTNPVKGLTLLLVLRSDYQTLLEEIGLPVPRSGENLFQVARFQLSAATAFMKQSGLDLSAKALDDLVTSAAELDDTPGLVRPITLNVIGHVLASGKGTAPSLDAGRLVRQYIEQTLRQPAIRDLAPRMLEQMITEQGTKRPRSESELASTTKLRVAEVRAVLNYLCEAGIVRPLNPTVGVWELTHDFVARAVGRFLGRHRSEMLRRAGSYAAPALLAISLISAVGAVAWNRFGPDHTRSQLADLGVAVRNDIIAGGMTARAGEPLTDSQFEEVVRLLQSLSVRSLDLSGTGVENVEPLRGLTALQNLYLNNTQVENVEPLRGLTALQMLDLDSTKVENVEPLRGLTALRSLNLTGTRVENVEPLKGLTARGMVIRR
jgi:TIR domain